MATLTSIQPRAGGFLVSEAEHHRSRDQILILSGQVVVSGHVLGAVMVGGVAVAAPASGNAGLAAMGAVTVGGGGDVGVYEVIMRTAGATGAFEVQNPDGVIVGEGAVGTLFNQGGLSFTLADNATHAAIGDRYLVTVSGGAMKYKEYNPANTDGSQVPAAISWDAYDATLGDVKAAAITRDAQVNEAELTWFEGATAGQIAAALAMMAEAPMRIIGRPDA